MRSNVLILRKFCFKTHYEVRFTLKGFYRCEGILLTLGGETHYSSI
jgi:hypothetical protein